MAELPDADREGPDAKESDKVKTEQRPKPAKCRTCKGTFYVSYEHSAYFGVANSYACLWCSVDKEKLKDETSREIARVRAKEEEAKAKSVTAQFAAQQTASKAQIEVAKASAEQEKRKQEEEKTKQEREKTKQAEEKTKQEMEKTKQEKEKAEQEKQKTDQLKLNELRALREAGEVSVNEVFAMLQRHQAPQPDLGVRQGSCRVNFRNRNIIAN